MSTENMRFAPSTTYPRLTAAILLAGVAAGLAALAGCGSGDDHQNTTPPPPATPAFTSSAAATAAEGVAYTYTPAATVSDGSTIAFSMDGDFLRASSWLIVFASPRGSAQQVQQSGAPHLGQDIYASCSSPK